MARLTHVVEIRPLGSPFGVLQGPIDIYRALAYSTTQEPNGRELLAGAGLGHSYSLPLLKRPTRFLRSNNRGMVALCQLLARLLLARRGPLRLTPRLDGRAGIKPGTV